MHDAIMLNCLFGGLSSDRGVLPGMVSGSTLEMFFRPRLGTRRLGLTFLLQFVLASGASSPGVPEIIFNPRPAKTTLS